ncbi:MAG: DUF4012 domain-containing protein [Candidatus Magasanikbacteria bacterium]|nr:DUF4012 domain-containing protein [Candidatus Magasanikbacteria bacterium]
MPRLHPPKKNLRRCKTCHAVGHNRATCEAAPPLAAATQSPTSKGAGLKFFIHHVQTPAVTSAHLINLKTNTSPWHKIESVAPTVSPSPLYHFYHEAPAEAPPLAPTKHTTSSPRPEPVSPPSTNSIDKIFSLRPTRSALPSRSNLFSSLFQSSLFKKEFKYKLVGAALAAIALFALPRLALSYYEDLHSSLAKLAVFGTSGFKSLAEATTAIIQGNLALAEQRNGLALNELRSASEIIRSSHPLLQTTIATLPLIGNRVTSGQELVLAAEELAVGNAKLLAGLPAANPSSTLLARLSLLSQSLRLALPHYRLASSYLKDIDAGIVPAAYQSDLLIGRALLESITHDLSELVDVEATIAEIFGGHGQRTYLLVFQNEHEIRPTGGFIGSFALANFKDGKLLSLEIPPGGSYDLQGQLDTYLEPPLPLSLANKRWEFQDANWFPDFPSSAEKLLWFYRHSRAVTLDGVIAINGRVLERLLTLSGPVNIPERGLAFSKDNAILALQSIIESEPERKSNKPKAILSEISPALLNYFSEVTPGTALPLLVTLADALKQKEIQAYFVDPAAEALVDRYGWSGRLLGTSNSQDFLYVVSANIQGGKSDRAIKQNISHQSVISGDGSIINTVEITREHQGSTGNPLYDQANINYLRLYVPAGSVLLSASGFSWPDEKLFRVPYPWAKIDANLSNLEQEIAIDEHTGTRVTKEFGKYAFGNWVVTEPGTISRVRFSYRLPFKAWNIRASHRGDLGWLSPSLLFPQTGRYQLVVMRQSGVESAFESQVILPPEWRPAWHSGPKVTLADNGVAINLSSLNSDTIWSVAFKK